MAETEIPEDIRVVATNVAIETAVWASKRSVDVIARAILDERERCAKIAEAAKITGNPANTSLSAEEVRVIDIAFGAATRHIASAIRSGAQHE